MKLYQTNQPHKSILNNTYRDESGRIAYRVHTLRQSSNRITTITKFIPSSPPDLRSASLNDPQSDGDAAHGHKLDPHQAVPSSPPECSFKIGLLARERRGDYCDGDDDDTSTLKEIPSGIDVDNHDSESDLDDITVIEELENTGAGSSFMNVAQIEWNLTRSNNIIRFGDGKEVEATKFFTRSKWRERVFTASDGIEYKWIMGLTSSELFKNDDSKEPVATFHSSSSKLGNGIGNWFKSKPTSKSQNQNTSYLEIHPEGRHIPGEILLTFIYIEQERTREDVDVAAESYASGSNFKRVNVPTDVDTMNLLETHLTVPERVARDSESFVQRIAVSDAREGDVVGGNGKEKKKGKAKKRITVPTDLDDLFIQDLRTSEAVALRLAGSGVI